MRAFPNRRERDPRLKVFALALLLALSLLAPRSLWAKPAKETPAKERPPVEVKELIFGHLQDAYQWHFFSIGSRHISLSLPIIVHSKERGWFVFSSKHLLHEAAHAQGTPPTYKGFYLATQGLHKDKVVEQNAAGEEVRPLDISLTKNALALLISCGLLVLIVLSLARWYKKHDGYAHTPEAVPTGVRGFMELFIMDIQEGVIKSCIGKDYKRYSPYLLTAFFFIFFNNVLGLIPIFPAGANLTGNIAVTCVLALCTFIAINVFGNKEYWKEILWPDVPLFLKAPAPIMPIIELIGLFTKPFALMIRLFANIFAGHCVILALTSLIFITAAMGPVLNSSLTIVSVLFSLFMLCLELLVAYIQAYVFTMLSAVFIGMSRPEHHREDLLQKEQKLKATK